MDKKAIPLTFEAITAFKPVKHLDEAKLPAVSMDIDGSGEHCVLATQDESILLYDCRYATHKKTLFSKKYGIDLVRFTHEKHSIVHTSTKNDDIIRYLSLHTNSYIKYFKGHKARVTSMEMSPMEDLFISGSVDKTVRLWDLRSDKCQGLANVTDRPVAAFDSEGLIFAIGVENTIRLYDLRNFDRGPFNQIPRSREAKQFAKDEKWDSIQFSPNGKELLVTTRGGKIYICDSVDCKINHVLTDFSNVSGTKIDASFSPSGNHIISGSDNGKVHFWDAKTYKKIVQLDSQHPSKMVNLVQFNPKFMMMVSASDNVNMWLPILE